MTIEISTTQGRSPAELGDSTSVGAKPQNSDTAKAAVSTASSADKVSLTGETEHLRQLEQQISSLPVVNTQRVEQVQHALASGSFQIDPAQVADKLLSFEAGLSDQGQG